MSINFGIVFFDRNSLNFLMPFVQPDLGLSNTQVGMLAGALSLTWAVAAFAIGLISDKTGNRKALLIVSTLAFSACSFLIRHRRHVRHYVGCPAADGRRRGRHHADQPVDGRQRRSGPSIAGSPWA